MLHLDSKSELAYSSHIIEGLYRNINKIIKIMKKVAVMGTGSVGQTISLKFAALGYDVMIGTRNVEEKLASDSQDAYGNPPFSAWHVANKQIKLGSFREAAAFGETVVNVTQGGNSIAALKMAGEENLKGKILIDIANPLDFSRGMPPGLISDLSNTNSLGEEIQKTFPAVRVVKTLNTMWCGLMVNPQLLNGGDHTVFICGDDSEAKEDVKGILIMFGWPEKNILDLGGLAAARGTEMYLPLWLSLFGVTKKGAFNLKVLS